MKHGKREMPRSLNFKGRTSLIALALIFCCGVGGTLAWLATKTEPVVNTFTPAHVTCEVQEGDFNHTEKKNVYVLNTSDTEAYIRVALVPTWVNEQGNVVAEPASLGDLNITYNSSGWIKGEDGYWYCTAPINAGDRTPTLIERATVKTANDYRMDLQILAEAIQAKGTDGNGTPAVELAWPAVTVNRDKTLNVKNS